MAKFRRSRRAHRSAPRKRSFLGRLSHRARGPLNRVRRFTRRGTSGIPSWAKPSKFAAATGVTSAALQLAFVPLSSGDSWMGRVVNGWGYYQASGNPLDLIGQDSEGNNIFSIAALQMKQNALPAIGTVTGFGIAASVLKYFGM